MQEAIYEEMWRKENAHWWFVGRRRVIRRLIRHHIDVEDGRRLKVCDLGCGTGGNIASWAHKHDVFGMDASEHALHFASKRLGQRVAKGSLPDAIPFPASHFDAVLMTDVLEHVEDDRASARAALELLRPQGLLIATVPAHQWLFSQHDVAHHHFRRYNKKQFGKLFDAPHVRLELLSFYNMFLFPVAAATRLWAKCWRPRSTPGNDLDIPPKPVNSILKRVFAFEGRLLGRVPLPFGLSLVAVARKV